MISARLVFVTGSISGLLAVALTAAFFLTGLQVIAWLARIAVLTGVVAVFVGVGAVMTGKIKNDLKS
jgi:hypothetical protein